MSFVLTTGIIIMFILAVAFIIYMFVLNSEQQTTVMRILKAYWFIPLIAIIYFIVKDDWGSFGSEDWIMQKANFILVCVVTLIVLTKAYMGKWRYDTPRKFIAHGLDGSFAADPLETENGFLIFSLDGILADVIHMRKGNRIAVIRKETGEYMKESFISISHMKLIQKELLPKEVRQRIDNISYLKGIEEIWYGYFDAQKEEEFLEDSLQEFQTQKEQNEIYKFLKEHFDVKNPTFGDLKLLLETTFAQYNKLAEQFEAVTKSTELFGGHIKRMGDAFTPTRTKAPPAESEESY